MDGSFDMLVVEITIDVLAGKQFGNNFQNPGNF